MSLPTDVNSWSIDQVGEFLDSIGLGQLKDAFKTNAVNGSDLVGLSDEDYRDSLGCTPLQIKKIHKQLEAFGIAPAAAVTAPAVTASAPAPAAPAPAPVPAPVPVTVAAPAPVAPPPVAAGPTPGERSAQVQMELQQLQTRMVDVQRGAAAYAAGQQHLRQAEANLKSAASALTVTAVSGATETLQDMRIGMRGGGMFGRNRRQGNALDRRNDFGHNMVEIATVQRAKGQVQAAGQAIQMAQQQLPNLPFIQPAHVQQAMGGVMFNALLAPGLIGDMMQQVKVRKAKDEVNAMHVAVVQAVDWCNNNMNGAQAEISSLNAQIMQKQSELSR